MIPYQGERRRPPHQRWFRSDGFRELMLAHGWSLHGYAKKWVRDRTMMAIILGEEQGWLLVQFDWKDDFLCEYINAERDLDAQKMRESFHVVKD